MSIPIQARRIACWLVMNVCVVLGYSACETTPMRGALGEASAPGSWHEADARVLAEEVVKEMLGQPWKQRFTQFTGRAPVLIVGPFLNRTHDQLNTQALIKGLQQALVESGQVRSVADAGQRQEVRQERAEPGQHTRPDTVKPVEQAQGADFVLQGSITSLVGAADDAKTPHYQVVLELVDIASNVKVWVGQKRLKKLLDRAPKTL